MRVQGTRKNRAPLTRGVIQKNKGNAHKIIKFLTPAPYAD